VNYLSYNALLQIHDDQIQEYGGEDGLRDSDLLKSAHRQPLQSYGGKEIHPSLFKKIAALGYGIINNHPFVDGNKRTGTASMVLLLEMNGHKLNARNDELVEMARSVARGEMSQDELSDWLESRSEGSGRDESN
jgi:death-on-curing protein